MPKTVLVFVVVVAVFCATSFWVLSASTAFAVPVPPVRQVKQSTLAATPDTSSGQIRISSQSATEVAHAHVQEKELGLHECPRRREPLSDEIPTGMLLPMDVVASTAAEKRLDSLMKRYSAESSSSQHQRLRDEIVRVKRQFLRSTYKLENSTIPTIDKIWQTPRVFGQGKQEQKLLPKDSVLYVVLTGKNSHASRIQGIHFTLGAMRNVLWFSDEYHPLIDPIVLQSDFEDEVCEKELVEETMLKGCRYQRNFYRSLMMWDRVALELGLKKDENAVLANGTKLAARGVNVSLIQWVVRLSDDTMVIPTHLEQRLMTLGVSPQQDSVVMGKNETRASYWFFSGGHAVAFSLGAVRLLGMTLNNCEGLVIDVGGKKYQKYWWWADDVLLTVCLTAARTFDLRELEGCFSGGSFVDLPIPDHLWEPLNNTERIFVEVSGIKRPRSRQLCRTRPELPTSYHAFPYISSYQMFGVFNRLYSSRSVRN